MDTQYSTFPNNDKATRVRRAVRRRNLHSSVNGSVWSQFIKPCECAGKEKLKFTILHKKA